MWEGWPQHFNVGVVGCIFQEGSCVCRDIVEHLCYSAGPSSFPACKGASVSQWTEGVGFTEGDSGHL